MFADQDVLVSDIPFFSDLSVEALKGLAPSEIEPLVTMIREVNARFFVTWRRRLAAVTGLPATAPIGLPRSVAGLIRHHGHANAWDYPWAVFRAAIDEIESGR